MPYVEILAPPAPPHIKAALVKSITDGLMSTFGVDAQTITLYFLPIPPGDYAHAGEMGSQGTRQRILLKVHAFRRSEAERRAAAVALTRSVCTAYGVPGTDVATYFLDREKDEVAHEFQARQRLKEIYAMDRFYTEDQRALRDTARRFAQAEILPRAAAIDREDRFDRSLYKGMADLGLFGICLREGAGGAGLDAVAACIAMEELARCSGAVANAFAIPVEAVLFFDQHGTETHKALIPQILSGEVIPATAVSEPDHGSDVAGIRTTAIRDGNGWLLNGTKAWVTLGGVADRIMVFARTGAEVGHRAISCLLVDGALPGIARGKNEELLGMHGLEDCQITFADVGLPADCVMGPENQAFKMAMSNFNFSRLMMASMALGMAQAAFEDATAYAKDRKQFGQPIIGFQAVQFMLADMATDIAAARLLIHHAARLHDARQPIAKEAAQAKLFTTDMAMKHVSNALQIHGGNGYSRDYRIERLFRDVRLAQIYEGTNQIQRLIIARQVEKEAA